MGTIKLYKPGRACQSYLGNTAGSSGNSTLETHPFKALDGTEYNVLYWSTNAAGYIKNALIYDSLIGYVSADSENDFSLDHYTTREISNISYSRTSSNQIGGKIYTIQATNNGAEDVTVGSIKFTKEIGSKNNSGMYNINCLLMAYFLDSPVTIPAGGVKTFVVNFDS